jgi:hypothetical protein
VTRGAGDFAVTPEESQLCVEGLRHGERYSIAIRRGLPSAIPGESLSRDASYDIYVRDRTPAVRFTGRNYVLPRTGQEGIPVVAVNTARLDIDIVRIGERNLVNTVHSEDFLTQLGSFGARKVAEEQGRKIWSGSMAVRTELNRDVVTTFPVLTTVGDLQPGIYVMFARPSGRPADEDGDDGQGPATQWFVVSDIGLTAFSGPDGVHVLARSLATAQPMAGVALRLIARNNEVLGEARTDAAGLARFDAGLARGTLGLAPGLVQASLGGDHGFLDLKQSAFDLTDRGVKGRVAPAALDAFLYTERGVYRSGETVHLAALLRDTRGQAVTGLPLTLIVRRPDGVEYRRITLPDQGGGGRAVPVPLLSGVPAGAWKAQAFTDPKRDAIGEVSFLVEDYVPEKLEIEVKASRPALAAGEPAEINLAARFLYGAVGADLDVTGEVTVRPAAKSAIPGFDGYSVGLTEEAFEPVKADIEGGATTDAQGKATLSVAIPEAATTRPVEAEIVVRVAEPGGRAVARSVVLPILPTGTVIGVKPLFRSDEIGEGQTARFHVIVADGSGRRLARPAVRWTLSRVSRNYQWFYQDGRWAYEGVKTSRRVADGTVAAGTDAPAEIAARVDWGSYRLDVAVDGVETSVPFVAGYEGDRTADTPETLEMTLDKSAYSAGDTLRLRLSPRFAGKATVALLGDRLHRLVTADVPAGGTTLEIPVQAEWNGGLYAVAMVHRPLDVAAKRMPGRAIGVAWMTVDRAARTLATEIDAPALAKPRQPLDIAVRVTGAAAGEEAFVTVAAVDVGILNLTRYTAPDPTAHYFGQRLLAHEMRDLYGYLIDGMQGTRGEIRSGGDAVAKGVEGEIPTQQPLAFFSGIMRVGQDGTAKVSFPLPAFNGTARVMAVAWTPGKTGQAARDVIIRDPVVATVTLPRFMTIGDQSRVHVALHNVEGPAGDYAVDLDVAGPVVAPAEALRRTVRLERGGRAEFSLPLTAAGVGATALELRVTGQGVVAEQRNGLRAQAPVHTIARRTVRPLEANGGQVSVSSDLLADLVPGSGRVAVSVSPLASLDVPALLKALDRYPYGCTEQTVSRALPLLYVNRLAPMADLGLDGAADERVRQAVERVVARQGSNGSFGLWGVGGEDLWLDAFVADFLTRAREQRIDVPQVAFSLALDRLRNQVVNTAEVRKEEAAGLAYAIYVLARNGRPVMGDLRYLADNKLGDFGSALSRAQIGAALALLGDRTRARTAFQSATALLSAERDLAVWRPDYGTRLRDAAGVMALVAESSGDTAEVTRAAAVVDQARGATTHTSTQEQMWMVLAAQALAADPANVTLAVNGTQRQGAFYRTYTERELEAGPVVIANRGQATARAVLTVSGTPLTPEPAQDSGFAVQRAIFDMKGQPVDPARMRQNERYVIAVKAVQRAPVQGRVLLVDPLPAGLEIENARLTDGATLDGLSFLKERGWLDGDVTPVHMEARDDRFVAAFEAGTAKPSFGAAYIARAVSPGRYGHPAASVEDMYRPDRFGRTAFGQVDIQPAR